MSIFSKVKHALWGVEYRELDPSEEPELEFSFERRERFEQIQEQMAGAIAKSAEEAGLICATDEFSYEYHQEFDPLIAEAEAQAQVQAEAETAQNSAPGSTETGDLDAGNTSASPEIGQTAAAGDTGTAAGDVGTGPSGSDFGSFGSNFSGNFGGEFNGNF